ncbi:2Fe-2S iron-sulfur cluster-binding protein [Sulfuriflexus mobilis]|uniref:2Fe-2S iron-sulfur cluster-binding protein n=1 Tax=Sulfuriflexus mobilis TaxID=1811807 RepID=UPI000F8450B2|nr:2Fe-2S iron-sulfur cluster-binding protein [Sulfuriflexus mobilis]
MGHKFAEIAFTPAVRAVQLAQGSHDDYDGMLGGEDFSHVLGDSEMQFIQQRDSFYIASISESGWPYIQHRGGKFGFIKVLDDKTIGYADFRGNRQYISTGNILNNNRVALFLMDYENRSRLKIFGHARLVDARETETMEMLEDPDYRAQVERGVIIDIEAFDWNCPQHITPRYTDNYIKHLLGTFDNKSKHTYSSELGNGPLKLVITGVRQLASNIRAYELRDPEGNELPEVSAGTNIRIPVKIDDGPTVYRHYSICSNPTRTDMYEIAVLQQQEGLGASIAVHANFDIGLVLNCQYPKNHFELHKDHCPAILIAGGVGITAIKPMAQQLKARGTNIHLHYAGKNHKMMAFRDRLEREFNDAITIYSSENNQHMDIENIIGTSAEDAVIYACGPTRLLDDVIATAAKLHINPQRIRIERFKNLPRENSKPIIVKLRRSNLEIYVNNTETILDAMLKAGVDSPYNCRTGACKSCVVRVIDGEPEHHDTVLSKEEREQFICPCVSRARTNHLVLDV